MEYVLAFAADTVLKAYGPVHNEGGGGVVVAVQEVIPANLLVILTTPQGLAFWSAVRASWVFSEGGDEFVGH